MKMRILVVATMLTLWLTSLDWVSAQGNLRTWTSRDKQTTIRADLKAYDAKKKLVTLVEENGDTWDVGLKRLSRADQRYVMSAKKLLKNGADSRELASDANDREDTSSGRTHKGVQKFGIVWQPTLQQALVTAEGSEGPRDDKPIMWFRVLGDMTGDM